MSAAFNYQVKLNRKWRWRWGASASIRVFSACGGAPSWLSNKSNIFTACPPVYTNHQLGITASPPGFQIKPSNNRKRHWHEEICHRFGDAVFFFCQNLQLDKSIKPKLWLPKWGVWTPLWGVKHKADVEKSNKSSFNYLFGNLISNVFKFSVFWGQFESKWCWK